jgi:formate C-acetyltransferase
MRTKATASASNGGRPAATGPSPRLEAIRRRFLDQGGYLGSPEIWLFERRYWLEHAGVASVLLRQARTRAACLRACTPAIDEGELIVGKPCGRAYTPDEEAEARLYRETIDPALIVPHGQRAHMAVDYEKLLRLGVSGVIREVEKRQARLTFDDPADVEKDEFYAACREVLAAVCDCSDRYAVRAEELARACADPARREELMELAGICRRVPREPARTFHEALQSVHFLTFCLKGWTFVLGRPDRYLWPFFERVRLPAERSQDLIDCFCFQFNERAGKGTSHGLMIGGRDAQGRDVTNELTWRFLESIPHTRLSYPSIGLCCTPDTPRALLRRSVEILGQGCTHPALFNDETIVRGLRRYGVPPAEACEYIHSACVEITPIASSGVWVASPYHNLVGYLLDVIGVTAGEAPEIASFDELKRRCRARLAGRIREGVIEQNRLQAERARFEGEEILASCFVNDCLERGRTIDRGGARYNWIMPSFVGLPNLADSLAALGRLVFEERRLTLSAFAEVLKRDFEGHDELRCEIVNRGSRYGNDQAASDALVAEITGWIVEEVARYRTYRGDHFIPSLFCWVMHERLGTQTPATPDGRRKGEALGDGAGPAQGRDRTGPSAAILSATAWDHTPFIGGVAVNLRFSPKAFAGEGADRVTDLVRVFLDRGGFELQINVVDADTLRRAQREPEQYRDLIVRIGGYSDYFTALSPEMQAEIIRRTEHGEA